MTPCHSFRSVHTGLPSLKNTLNLHQWQCIIDIGLPWLPSFSRCIIHIWTHCIANSQDFQGESLTCAHIGLPIAIQISPLRHFCERSRSSLKSPERPGSLWNLSYLPIPFLYHHQFFRRHLLFLFGENPLSRAESKSSVTWQQALHSLSNYLSLIRDQWSLPMWLNKRCGFQTKSFSPRIMKEITICEVVRFKA